MKILVKVGGAELDSLEACSQLAESVASARLYGHQVIVVHGGGNQIRRLSKQLGLAETFHAGLRVTNRETAETVLMVLGGQVNKTLTASFIRAGVPAAGLTGIDGGLFQARKLTPGGLDLGYVGEIAHVDPRLVALMLAADIVPIVAPLAPLAEGEAGDRDALYNINADHAAAPLARALGVEVLLFLTDVPGVLDEMGTPMTQLDPETCRQLEQDGVIHSGMVPKVHAAMAAANSNPGAIVKIAHGGISDAILRALRAGSGTRFLADLSANQPSQRG